MILVPKGNPAKVHSSKTWRIPASRSRWARQPRVGKLASQVIQNASADYGFDFVTNLRKNIAVRARRAATSSSDRAESERRITFASDVNPAKFDEIPIEDKYNVVSIYSMTVTKNAKNAALGKDFVALVASPEGKRCCASGTTCLRPRSKHQIPNARDAGATPASLFRPPGLVVGAPEGRVHVAIVVVEPVAERSPTRSRSHG